MGKRRKPKATVRAQELSLEEQLRELDENEVPGDPVRAPHMHDDRYSLIQPSAERVEWARKRAEIVGRLRKRDSKNMRDLPDEGGRYSPSPYTLQHGHLVEVAPQDLRTSKDSAFPKRIATQRMIDRYCVQGIITTKQWKAANRLWMQWRATGRDPKMCANYSPDQIRGSGSPDARMVGHSAAVAEYLTTMSKVSPMGYGVLMHVVVMDGSAAEWAQLRAHSVRVSGAIGLAFLTAALDELVAYFGY